MSQLCALNVLLHLLLRRLGIKCESAAGVYEVSGYVTQFCQLLLWRSRFGDSRQMHSCDRMSDILFFNDRFLGSCSGKRNQVTRRGIETRLQRAGRNHLFLHRLLSRQGGFTQLEIIVKPGLANRYRLCWSLTAPIFGGCSAEDLITHRIRACRIFLAALPDACTGVARQQKLHPPKTLSAKLIEVLSAAGFM